MHVRPGRSAGYEDQVIRRAAAAALCLAVLGCPSRPKTAVYDLAERASVAELTSPRDVVIFGTPAAEPHLADGFYRERSKPGGEGFVWARADCQIAFTWTEVRPRT